MKKKRIVKISIFIACLLSTIVILFVFVNPYFLSHGKLDISVTIDKKTVSSFDVANFTIHVKNAGTLSVNVVDFWAFPKGPGMFPIIKYPNGTAIERIGGYPVAPRPPLADRNVVLLGPGSEIKSTFQLSNSSCENETGPYTIIGCYSIGSSEDITVPHWTGTIYSEPIRLEVTSQ